MVDFRDKPAIVQVKLGEGTGVYMGASSPVGAFERKIVQDLLTQSGAKPLDFPENVFGDWHQGLYVITNHSNKPYTPTHLFPSDRIVGIGPVIEAGGVGVYKWFR
jgi:hypothetical protein